MYSNCVNFKIRKKKYIRYYYCSIKKQKIELNYCKNCIDKKYKEISSIKSKVIMKSKSYIKSKYKKDKNLISIIPKSDKWSTTYVKGFEKHHIIGGRNRCNSEKYGLFIWINSEYHRYLTDNPIINKELIIMSQLIWEENFGSREEFIEVFRESFIK